MLREGGAEEELPLHVAGEVYVFPGRLALPGLLGIGADEELVLAEVLLGRRLDEVEVARDDGRALEEFREVGARRARARAETLPREGAPLAHAPKPELALLAVEVA